MPGGGGGPASRTAPSNAAAAAAGSWPALPLGRRRERLVARRRGGAHLGRTEREDLQGVLAGGATHLEVVPARQEDHVVEAQALRAAHLGEDLARDAELGQPVDGVADQLHAEALGRSRDVEAVDVRLAAVEAPTHLVARGQRAGGDGVVVRLDLADRGGAAAALRAMRYVVPSRPSTRS